MDTSPEDAGAERTSNRAQDALGISGAAMEEGLGIGLEHVETSAVMIVCHFAPPHAEQVVQGLEFRRVRRQEHQRQPGAVPLPQIRHLPRLVGAMKPGIIEDDHRAVLTAARSPHQGIAQLAEGPSIPAIRVAADSGTVAPIDGNEEVTFAVLPGGRDLSLVSPPRPAPGQRQLGLIFHIELCPRRRAYEERLGTALFDAYAGSRRATWRTVHVGRRGT
jgi:hypothetical protein